MDIKLTSGKICIIDDEDSWVLDKFKLYSCKGHVKACMSVETEYGSAKLTVYLHRLILGLTKKTAFEIDHKNRNGHDNRKENLRFASRNENSYNKKRKGSKYKGVSVRSNHKTKKFGAFIRYGKNSNNLGYFISAEQAAKLYDINAILQHKEFAYINFENLIPVYNQIIEQIGLNEHKILVLKKDGFAIKEKDTPYLVRSLPLVNNKLLNDLYEI